MPKSQNCSNQQKGTHERPFAKTDGGLRNKRMIETELVIAKCELWPDCHLRQSLGQQMLWLEFTCTMYWSIRLITRLITVLIIKFIIVIIIIKDPNEAWSCSTGSLDKAWGDGLQEESKP